VYYLKKIFHRYERRIGFLFLAGGFIFDNLTLTRVDLFLDNMVLLFYLVLVAVGIIVINSRAEKYHDFIPYAMQFAFGGLFSGFLVFYFRSGSVAASLPFFLMLAIFFVGNEFFRERYKLFNFHLAVFFVALYSYAIFSLPILLRQLGADVFILSGFLSLIVIFLLFYLIKKISPQKISSHGKLNAITIIGIYFLFNIFYFANIIPPIPLALKEGGIYRNVERVNGDYVFYGKEKKWYQFWQKNKYSFVPGESVYAYTAVFAPTKINSQIFHRWSFYDPKNKEWVESGKIGFPIKGGRDGGYRGYSVKESIFPGKWRVDVVTERGQIIGRIGFEII